VGLLARNYITLLTSEYARIVMALVALSHTTSMTNECARLIMGQNLMLADNHGVQD